MFSRSFKEKNRDIWLQSENGALRARPSPPTFEAKAMATKMCPRDVLEDEDSPRGPHPW